MADPCAPAVVLLGSKPGAIVALEVLLDMGFRVHAVVGCEGAAHPWFGGPTLPSVAQQRGVPVVGHQAEVPAGEVDFVVSYMFRHRVRRELLARARRAAVNFHAAPLPEYGGYAFYNTAILEQAASYGVTCHHMDEGFDTGPLLEVRRFAFDCERATAQSLEQRSQLEMLSLFEDFCARARSGETLPAEPQPAARRRYLTLAQFEAGKQCPADAAAATRDRWARAFWFPPHPGAFVLEGGQRVPLLPAPALRTPPVPYHATLRALRARRRQHERH